MQDVKTVQLADGMVNYLQALSYEADGLKVLHTHALNAGAPQEKTEEIRQRFQEKFAEYRMALDELWAPYKRDYPRCRWWVDFQEGVLHIAQQQA